MTIRNCLPVHAADEGRQRSGGIAVHLLAVGVATSSWNALPLGPLTLSQAALVCAGAMLILDAGVRGHVLRVPWWIWPLTAAIVVSAALSFFRPPPLPYYIGRYIGDVGVWAVSAQADPAWSGLLAAVQWLAAATALPLIVCLAVCVGPGVVHTLLGSFVLGAAGNAAVALSDQAGVSEVSAALIGVVDSGGRQAGLTIQPNHLATAIAIALPMLIWSLADTDRAKARGMWCVIAVVLAAGLMVTGSRGGLVAGVVGVVAGAFVQPRARAWLPLAAVVTGAAALAAAVVRPDAVLAAARRTRLLGSDLTAASDSFREGLSDQAWRDFFLSPVHGIGMEVSAQAHNVYLQVAASGGLVLMIGFLITQCGFLAAPWSCDVSFRRLASALATAGATYLVGGAVGNQLTDVFVHVPLALMAGLSADRFWTATYASNRSEDEEVMWR